MYATTSLGRKLGLRDSIFSGLRHGEYPGTKVTLGPEISALAGGFERRWAVISETDPPPPVVKKR